MTETVQKESTSYAPKKEQFEFILTINGNIICQRYFRINGFKRQAYGSLDLLETIDNCVDMIHDDLKTKTDIYLFYTTPQVFNDKVEMYEWAERHKGEEFVRPIYVTLRDSEDVYVWDGEEITYYEKNFNRADYVADPEKDQSYTLKFAFCDNGREVISKSWSADVYPRFIRANIDISNSKNKYKADGVFMPVERFVVDEFIESQTDLIPALVKELCSVCSYDDVTNYDTTVTYGDKTYDLNLHRANNRYFKSWENKCKKKTAEYFRGR